MRRLTSRERAAIARDEGRGQPGRAKGALGKNPTLTFTAFAALGITGLRTHDTVARYHRD